MNATTAKILVLVGEHFACVKVAGRANFASSVDFKKVLTELHRKGCNYIVVELSECALMDSTFLGVLAGFGIKMQSGSHDCVRQIIELRNTNERLIELLESLGVLHLFKSTHSSMTIANFDEASCPAPCNPSREELTRASLEAHKVLMEINPANISKFKDVAKFLAEDLEKLQRQDLSKAN